MQTLGIREQCRPALQSWDPEVSAETPQNRSAGDINTLTQTPVLQQWSPSGQAYEPIQG